MSEDTFAAKLAALPSHAIERAKKRAWPDATVADIVEIAESILGREDSISFQPFMTKRQTRVIGTLLAKAISDFNFEDARDEIEAKKMEELFNANWN